MDRKGVLKWGLTITGCLVFVLALSLVVVKVPALACHAEGGADCTGWWVNLFGPSDDWVLDHTEGAISGTWTPGQTEANFDVTAYYKKLKTSGHYVYTNRPTTPPVYDCELFADLWKLRLFSMTI